ARAAISPVVANVGGTNEPSSPTAFANRATCSGSTVKPIGGKALPSSSGFSVMRSGSELPAGDREHDPGDVVGLARSEEQVCIGHVLGPARMPERDEHQRHLSQVLRHPQ